MYKLYRGIPAIRDGDVPRDQRVESQWKIMRFFPAFRTTECSLNFMIVRDFGNYVFCELFFFCSVGGVSARSAVWRNKTLLVARKLISMKMSEQFFFINGVLLYSHFSRFFSVVVVVASRALQRPVVEVVKYMLLWYFHLISFPPTNYSLPCDVESH